MMFLHFSHPIGPAQRYWPTLKGERCPNCGNYTLYLKKCENKKVCKICGTSYAMACKKVQK